MPVYFSAQILNELAGARDPERLTTLALLTLSVTAALAIVTALLRRWKEICSSAKYQRNLFVQIVQNALDGFSGRRRAGGRMSCSPRCGRTRIGPGTA